MLIFIQPLNSNTHKPPHNSDQATSAPLELPLPSPGENEAGCDRNDYIIYIHICVCIYVYICMQTYICIHTDMYVYVYMYTCMHINICIC